MDDFPAGPASPEPRERPALSVVIPVHNGGRDFERCLRGLRESSLPAEEYELVVVDDGSTDGSGELAARFGACVLRRESPRGPASARNDGAAAASAEIVFFLDADVVPHRDTLERALECFAADPALDALFGSYDDAPAHPGRVSQFRNLLHHYVHQQGEFFGGQRPAHTFWTGCGAIRRSVFLDLGGFDPSLYRRPAIEDIELGYRLSLAGHKIALARDLQATHLKRWTLAGMIRTDLFQRGVPWMLLMLRSRVAETDLNVSRSQRLSVLATGLGLWGLSAAFWRPSLALLWPLGLVVLAVLNLPFYRFLAQRRGAFFALTSLALHYAYFCCCGFSVVFALAIRLTQRSPAPIEPVRSSIPRPMSATHVRSRRTAPWDRP